MLYYPQVLREISDQNKNPYKHIYPNLRIPLCVHESFCVAVELL